MFLNVLFWYIFYDFALVTSNFTNILNFKIINLTIKILIIFILFKKLKTP